MLHPLNKSLAMSEQIKIEGWVDQFAVDNGFNVSEDGNVIHFQKEKELSKDLRCTLIIGEGKVYTQQEISAMANEIIDQATDGRLGPLMIQRIMKRHNIILLP